MKERDYSGARSLSFNEAADAFKGYPSFVQIPEDLFSGICENIDQHKIEINIARGKIAQVIWEDQVKKRNLTKEEKMFLLDDIKREVAIKLRQHLFSRSSPVRLVDSAD